MPESLTAPVVREDMCPICGCPRRDTLRVSTIAATFQVHASTITRLLATGEMQGIRIGKRVWRVPHASLHAYLRAHSCRADEGVVPAAPSKEDPA